MNEQLLRTIEDRIDIVELISESTDLVRRGNRYWGLCPFHSEKTPSFSVSVEKRLFYCFGCHVGGNIFTFVMKRDNLSFKEAVELLAAKAGIEYAPKSGWAKKRKQDEERIIEVNELAAAYYHQLLKSDKGARARRYLEERGINWETAVAFQLGYAPDEWRGLLEYLISQGYSGPQLVASGLIKRSTVKDSYYDIFRDRVIFPIRNRSGAVVGMGGRSLNPTDTPKYLNTPETPIFSKRNNLYGLFQARDHIRRLNEVILVEGYMDCIMLHQYGIRQAVASLGTAFTIEQARLLRGYAEKVVLIYDGDKAGQREALRATELMTKEGLAVEVVVLPEDQDPDEYIMVKGKEEFLQYIKNNKKNPIEFKLEFRLRGLESKSLVEKLAVLHEVFPDLQQVRSLLELENHLAFVARKLDLPENAVTREFRAWQRKTRSIGIIRNRNSTNRYNKGDKEKFTSLEFQVRLLARMVHDENTFKRIFETCGTNFFADSGLRKVAALFQEASGFSHHSRELVTEAVQNQPELAAALARVEMVEEENWPSDYEIERFIREVKRHKMEKKWQGLLSEIETQKNKGDFYDILRLILKADYYLRMEEGGEL